MSVARRIAVWIYATDYGNENDVAYMLYPVATYPRRAILTANGYPRAFLLAQPRQIRWIAVPPMDAPDYPLLLVAWL